MLKLLTPVSVKQGINRGKMKIKLTITKVAAVAMAFAALSSCSKKQDELSNITMDRKDAGQAQVLDQNINSALTLTDRVNGVDYIVSGNIDVNAALTIQPGVTIMFKDNAGLTIQEQGSITAIGEKSNTIYFTSQAGKRNSWQGITVLSNTHNVLEYCKVEHGAVNVTVGTNNNAAVMEISNSEITAAGADGITVARGSQITHFEGNKIYTNTAFPVSLYVADAGMLSNNNQYYNNGKEFIHLLGGSYTETTNMQLNHLNEPYLISGTVIAGGEFKIMPGTRLYMDVNASLIIDGTTGHGSFSAVGSAGETITIAGLNNAVGIWNAIIFRSSASNSNRIEYCNISGGGLGSYNGMIVLENENTPSQVIIRNNNIMNSAASGIYIGSSSQYNSDINTANTFMNNANGNVKIG